MNYKNYIILNQIVKELKYEKGILEKELENNLLQMKEADLYISSFIEQEEQDYKVFSPRNAEAVYKNEIQKAREKKDALKKKCDSLEDEKNVVSSRVNLLEKILAEENIFTKNFAMLQAQEDDRQRIARELHDTSLQNLTHLIHKIELSSLYIDQDPDRAKKELSDVNKNIKEVIEEIRNTIYDLRSMTFDDLGLKAAFERLLENINDKRQYKIDAEIDNVSCENNLVLLTIYRVTQECLVNIVKHASADKIIFRCKYMDGICTIEISDNGKGFSLKRKKEDNRHFGISLMRERLDLLGGSIDIFSKKDRGTKIIIRVPLSSPY